MKKKSVPIIFFGNERLATGVNTDNYTLKALINAGYNVKAVVSNYNPLPSRNSRELEIEAIAKNNSIPFLIPKKLTDIKNDLANFNAKIAVLVAYGQLIPDDIIDLFPSGIINIHPSLLPLYRGSTPIEQTILDGVSKTGISLMKLVKKMDAGPVFKQTQITLEGHETKQYLADKLLELGSQLLVENLPSIINDTIQPISQGNSKASYCSNLTKKNGYIDWDKTAVQLEREIRAFFNWPKSQTIFGGKNVIITKAVVVNDNGRPGTLISNSKHLIVCCGKQALEITELSPAGKPVMDVKAFLAGYRTRLV